MLTILGTLISGILSGGATGLLGVLLQRYFDLQHKKQEIEIVKLNLQNSIELAKMENERAQQRNETDLQLADRQLEATLSETDSANLIASFKHDSATYLDATAQRRKGFVGALVVFMMASVDFLRGIIRPGMTAYLCVLVTIMFMWVRELANTHGVKLTSEQVQELMVQIIATILYVFTVCTVWWFGVRPPNQSK